MIQYETDKSPFFVANKNYCEAIAAELKTMNLDCSGFCNCYGYDLEASFNKQNLTYTLQFHKHQSTQNGVVIPVNALDSLETELKVTGLNKKNKISFGKSAFKRIFTSKNNKQLVSPPYYIHFNFTGQTNFINNLISKIKNNNISRLKLSNGTLVCKIYTSIESPLNLISDIEMSFTYFLQATHK